MTAVGISGCGIAREQRVERAEAGSSSDFRKIATARVVTGASVRSRADRQAASSPYSAIARLRKHEASARVAESQHRVAGSSNCRRASGVDATAAARRHAVHTRACAGNHRVAQRKDHDRGGRSTDQPPPELIIALGCFGVSATKTAIALPLSSLPCHFFPWRADHILKTYSAALPHMAGEATISLGAREHYCAADDAKRRVP